jgi:hypothetical protein
MEIISGRYSGLALFILITAIIIIRIQMAKGGKLPKLRELAPIKAIEEGVGRAVEMGRPVLFAESIPHYRMYGGRGAAAIASLSILDRTARLAAKYGAELITAGGRTETYPIIQNITKTAYQAEGKAYNPDNNLFIPEEAYTVGMVGTIEGRRPATCVYSGVLVHESVIFGGSGAKVGAFQIAAGTAMNNIPFLIATCDYVLIGEELYTAAASISEEPVQMGSVAGQDMVKYVMLAILAAGVIMMSAGSTIVKDLLKL